MPGYTDVALDIKALLLPELRIPDLFIPTKLVPASYMSIASGPPPGLSLTPRLPHNTQISNSSLTTAPADAVPNSTPRRNSIQSYKSALQTARTDPAPCEASDSSGSTDVYETQHPAQLIQFTRKLSSPGRIRRPNPKLVESIASCQHATHH